MIVYITFVLVDQAKYYLLDWVFKSQGLVHVTVYLSVVVLVPYTIVSMVVRLPII